MDYDASYEWQGSTNESARNNNNALLNDRTVANPLTEYDCQSCDNDKGVYLVESVDAKRSSNESGVLTQQNERITSKRAESHIYDELEYDLSPSTQENSSHTSRIGIKENVLTQENSSHTSRIGFQENICDHLKENKILIGIIVGIILIVVIVVGIAVAIQGINFFFIPA